MLAALIYYGCHTLKTKMLVISFNTRLIILLTAISLCASGLSGCARGRSSYMEAVDYDLWLPLKQETMVVRSVFIPPHDIGDDCNGNGINDAYDWAGYIPRGPYPVGENPKAITAGDLTGNEKADLAVLNSSDGSVTVLRQHYDRNFETIATIDVGPNPSSISIADLNDDGHQDIIVGHEAGTAEFVTVLFNNGDGTSFRREDHPISDDLSLLSYPKWVIAADIDGGGADIVATSGIALNQMILTLMSNGAFDSPQHKQIGVQPSVLTAADFDRDTNLDLALIGGYDGRWVLAIRNQQSLSPPYNEFSEWACERFRTRISAEAIATGDLNGDGESDVVVAGNDGVSVLHNAGIWGYNSPEDDDTEDTELFCVDIPQRFERAVKYEDVGAQAIAVADADGDGDLDIILPLADDNTLTIMANRVGTFADGADRLRLTNFPVQDGPNAIFAGDIDGDGRIEIAVANRESNDIWVIHKRSSPLSMPFECMVSGMMGMGRIPEVP